MNRKILIADDHEGIRDILNTYSKKEGFTPFLAEDGMKALELFQIHQPNIVLLDVRMPYLDGYEVCREIRKTSDVPILMITARGEDADKIMGLDIGADDYIVKPFSPGEVMARIRAILRRMEPKVEELTSIVVGDLEVDISQYTCLNRGENIELSKREIEILWLMASNPGKVFSRENLLSSIWGYDYFGDARTVDTHMKRLRAKLNLPEDSSWEIKTVWGVGYKLEVHHEV